MFENRLRYVGDKFKGFSRLCINTENTKTMKDGENIYEFYRRVFDISDEEMKELEKKYDSEEYTYNVFEPLGRIDSLNIYDKVKIINDVPFSLITLDWKNTDDITMIQLVKLMDRPVDLLKFMPYMYMEDDIVDLIVTVDKTGTALKYIPIRDVFSGPWLQTGERWTFAVDIRDLVGYLIDRPDMYASSLGMLSSNNIVKVLESRVKENKHLNDFQIANLWMEVEHNNINYHKFSKIDGTCIDICMGLSKNEELFDIDVMLPSVCVNPRCIQYIRPEYQTETIKNRVLEIAARKGIDMMEIIPYISNPDSKMLAFAASHGAPLKYLGDDVNLDVVVAALKHDKTNIVALEGAIVK